MSPSAQKPPEILDKIVDLVLAHKPKPKSKTANKRKKAAKQRRHPQPSSVPSLPKT
jgi:hypothetical protein